MVLDISFKIPLEPISYWLQAQCSLPKLKLRAESKASKDLSGLLLEFMQLTRLDPTGSSVGNARPSCRSSASDHLV